MKLSRRNLMIGAAGVGIGGAILRPADNGAQYSHYFASLNDELKQQKTTHPRMLIDQNILDSNIDSFTQLVQAGQRRIVAKSLPSIPLLQYICDRAQTNKLMLFHLPFLQAVSQQMSDSDILIGKPLPAIAAQQFYAFYAQQADQRFQPAKQLQWLIDSHQRLLEYLAIAKQLDQPLLVNFEIDVGLHRGGYNNVDDFNESLKLIQQNPGQLQLSGLMGYDAHVGKVPSVLESTEATYATSQKAYQQYIDAIESIMKVDANTLCLNAAGSPTIAHHAVKTVANDISAGSCLVKPTDFDLATLKDFEPAAFIATPVLKKSEGVQLPGAGSARGIWKWLDPNQAQTFFIYGGYWKAKPYAPAGLQKNALYGNSTNQEMLNGSTAIDLAVNDFVFLRPTQSEHVLLQFGDLLMYRQQDGHYQWQDLAILQNP